MKHEKEYTTVHFVATPEIKSWLEERARDSERTVSQYMRVLIKEAMERNGRPVVYLYHQEEADVE